MKTVEVVKPPLIETRPDETGRIYFVERIVHADDRPKGYVGRHRAPEQVGSEQVAQ